MCANSSPPCIHLGTIVLRQTAEGGVGNIAPRGSSLWVMGESLIGKLVRVIVEHKVAGAFDDVHGGRSLRNWFVPQSRVSSQANRLCGLGPQATLECGRE